MGCAPIQTSSPTSPNLIQAAPPNPILTPSPQGTSMLEKEVIEESSNIRGPIQGLALTDQGNGLIFWQTEDNGSFILKGKHLSKYQATDFWSAKLAAPFNLIFNYGLNPDGKTSLIWNSESNNDFGTGNPKALSMLTMLPGEKDGHIESLGSYNMLDLAINESGNGFLMVSNESQTQLALNENKTSVLLLQVKEGIVQGSNSQELKTVPFHLGGHDVFLGGTLDTSGNGLVLWRDRALKIYAETIVEFKTSGNIQSLSLIPGQTPRTSLKLQLKDGRGYVSWPSPDGSGLKLTKVEKGLIQETSWKMLDFPTNEVYAATNYPSVPSWDFHINSKGDGLAAWTTANHKQAFYQGIKEFSLVGTSKKVFQQSGSIQIGQLRISGNLNGEKLLTGLETTCQEGTVSSVCIAKETAQKSIWISKPIVIN